MQPLVVAHRGASAHRPEQTTAAFELAFRLGADSVELDLLATCDGHLVCRHDLDLAETTDVARRPEFARRRRTVEIDGKPETGWFVHDFTLAEIRTLTARERWPKKRPGSAAFDGRFGVATFGEVLALVERESSRRGRPLQVHAELKQPAYQETVGLSLPELVDPVRRPEITWLSFDDAALQEMDRRGQQGLVRNFDKTPSARKVRSVAAWADGIGVRREAVLDDGSGLPTKLVDRAHRLGLGVLVWTHRAENKHLPQQLRIGRGGWAHGHGRLAAEQLFDIGVDALITDFPELGVAAREGRTGLRIAR